MIKVVTIGVYGFDAESCCNACVEADAEACHRSLVADRLTQQYGVKVEHLKP